MPTKQHFWKCETKNCQKGTNNAIYLIPASQEKTALCSKHYKEWLDIRSKYYKLAIKEFWEKE